MKKIVGTIAGVIILIILGIYLFRNSLIEYFGEKIGSQEYGAKIDIDDVDLDLFSANLKIGRVQITDKNNTMRNIGDLKNIDLVIEYKPILDKLIVLDKADIELIEILTPRTIDGAISKKNSVISPTDSSEPIKIKTEKKVKLDLNNIELDLNGDEYKKILDNLNIKIIKEYDTEKKKIEKMYSYWDKKLSEEGYKVKFKNAETKYKLLKENIKDEKDPLKILDELNKINELIDVIDNLVKEVESDKNKFDEDMNIIEDIQKNAFKHINSDYLFNNIVGWDQKKLQSDINLILNDYLNKYTKKNIDFFNDFNKKKSASEEATYDFWIKNTNLKFKYLNYTLKGKVKNITSKVGITPNPIKFSFSPDDKNIVGDINGVLNRETKKMKIKLNLSNLTIDDKIIEKNKNLIIIVGSKMNLSYNMSYENEILNLDGKIDLNDLKIDLDKLEVDPKFKEIIGKNLEGIDRFMIDYLYDNVTEKLSFNTNIPTILSNLIKNILDENKQKYKAEAKLAIEKNIQKYTKKLNIDVKKIEKLKKIIQENKKELKILENETKSNKDSKSTGNLIDGLEDGLKNLF